jgi:hypothetical protein
VVKMMPTVSWTATFFASKNVLDVFQHGLNQTEPVKFKWQFSIISIAMVIFYHYFYGEIMVNNDE